MPKDRETLLILRLQTLRDASGTPIVEFRDSRLSLYTGKDAISAAMQQSQADASNTSNGNASPNNPIDLYLQRQPVLRVQVSFQNYPFHLLSLLAFNCKKDD